jgi:hypothetical protein
MASGHTGQEGNETFEPLFGGFGQSLGICAGREATKAAAQGFNRRSTPLGRFPRSFSSPHHPRPAFSQAAAAAFLPVRRAALPGTLAAVGLSFYRPIGILELGLFFGMWLITRLGLTVGYRRMFTHRAFVTSTAMGAILIVMASWPGAGRCCPELSDYDGDLQLAAAPWRWHARSPPAGFDMHRSRMTIRTSPTTCPIFLQSVG